MPYEMEKMSMGKIKKCISLFYTICRAIIPPHKVRSSDKVLLVETGHIGDAIIDASFWQAITERAVSQGKEVYLLSTQEDHKILKRVLESEQITYMECDKDLPTVDSCRKVFSELKEISFDIIVVRPHGSKRIYLMSSAIPAIRRYAILKTELLSDRWMCVIRRIVAKRFTNSIVEDERIREKDVLEKMAGLLRISDYHMSILPICECERKHVSDWAYVTISVDSQNTARRWQTDRFITLIKELLKTYDEDIILTGSFLNEEDTKKYEEAFYGNERVYNFIGKCSFDQWIELLRGAHFHIGIDSGSIHVAASVGTTAFCLTGVWHGHRIFPYSMEAYQLGTTEPICVYRQDVDVDKIPCYGCAAKKEYGWGNRECLVKCRSGHPCLCLEKITVDDVMGAIEKAIRDGKIS